MTDLELADELIARLNDLIKDPVTCKAMEHLIAARIGVSAELAQHQTIQVNVGNPSFPTVGFLGMLNGLVGTNGVGRGFIHAAYNDAGELVEFRCQEK